MRFQDIFDSFFRPRSSQDEWNSYPEENNSFFSESWSFNDEDEFDDEHWFDFDRNNQNDIFRFGFNFGPNIFPPGFPHGHVGPQQSPHNHNDNRRSLRDEVLKQPDSLRDPQQQHVPPYHQPSQGREETSRELTPGFQQTLPDFNSMLEDFFGRQMFAPFLKNPLQKEDTDLDGEIESRGLDAVLKDQPPVDQRTELQRPKSFFQSIHESRSTIRRSDGSSEQRVTRRDAQGNEETTITTVSPNGERHTAVESRSADGTLGDASESNDRRSSLFKGNATDLLSPFVPSVFLDINRIFKDMFPR